MAELLIGRRTGSEDEANTETVFNSATSQRHSFCSIAANGVLYLLPYSEVEP